MVFTKGVKLDEYVMFSCEEPSNLLRILYREASKQCRTRVCLPAVETYDLADVTTTVHVHCVLIIGRTWMQKM